MSQPDHAPFESLSPAQQAEYLRRFGRAGYWLGVLPNHPRIQHPPPQPLPQPLPHTAYGIVPGAAPTAPFQAPHSQAPTHQHGHANQQQHCRPLLGSQPASQDAAPSQAAEVPRLDFSIPLNTTVIGARPSKTILRLSCDIPFADFWDRVCARMGVDPASAELGYKLSNAQAGDDPRVLASEDDFHHAVDDCQGAVCRARTRTVEVVIHNLKPPSQAPSSGATGKKRKQDAIDADDVQDIVKYKEGLRALSKHLMCARHTRHCYISPIDGSHVKIDNDTLTFWAKKISLSEATLTRPPNLLQFDHAAKRRRTASSGTSQGTNIHLVLSDRVALGNRDGQHHANSDSPPPADTDSDDSDVLVAYPDILVALRELHEVMPIANLLQFEPALRAQGIHYVDGAEHVSKEFLAQEVGMPPGVIPAFTAHVTRLAKRARKGKGGHCTVPRGADGGDEENKPIIVE
ncbi:hypothetical protein L226DRAFT_576331 [Lentinus tigrinus ALCF2SS1-7]|uniref:Uncharacterized protein n=1 Tax=Lentinus tigrinus ALCF2SS1-6 TaxID=1328759 RepID=A0A5C2RXH0_9APHY|nr:hypothetical protein L227DRAFT_615144 [Lentinus tigrinus ALCF2SS1-6]RPD68520.1 hypothetical protein L226DRAFT_576331 [Lentinus tigrinus ALCF2SS1-7]